MGFEELNITNGFSIGNKYALSYGSRLQEELEQDIESVSFKTKDELLFWLAERLSEDFIVYVVTFDEIYDTEEANLENPSGFITRDHAFLIETISGILKYALNDNPCVYVFEYETYEDALDYLKDSFETSSKAFK